jgi:hypothetical protein
VRLAYVRRGVLPLRSTKRPASTALTGYRRSADGPHARHSPATSRQPSTRTSTVVSATRRRSPDSTRQSLQQTEGDSKPPGRWWPGRDPSVTFRCRRQRPMTTRSGSGLVEGKATGHPHISERGRSRRSQWEVRGWQKGPLLFSREVLLPLHCRWSSRNSSASGPRLEPDLRPSPLATLGRLSRANRPVHASVGAGG